MANRTFDSISRATPEQMARARKKAKATITRMRLDDIRRARELSQEQLARELGVNQGAVSKVEHRTDLYISTLRRYIEAAGGELRIIAEFPGSEPVELAGFGDLEAAPAARRRHTAAASG
jgi:transcriptional regulator with XRE-family HTH domain